MNNTLIKHFYQWHKKEIWVMYLLILFPFISNKALINDDDFKRIILSFIFIFWLRFIRKTHLMIMPHLEGFSFKYLQSLPLNRKDLITSLGIISLIRFVPIIIIGAQWASLSEDVISVFKFTLSFVFILMSGSISQNLNAIETPRVEYFQKKLSKFATSRTQNIIGIIALIVSLFLYANLRWNFLDEYKSDILKYFIIPIGIIIDLLFIFLDSWLFPVVTLAMVFFILEKTLKTWENETRSYPKSLPKEDIYTPRIIATSFVLLFVHLYLTPPFRYIDNDLLTAVYNDDYEKVQNMISNGININQKNRHGYTALTVAAAEGNLKMYQFLEKNKAKTTTILDEKTRYPGYNVFNLALMSKNENLVLHILNQTQITQSKPNYSLHDVASKCMTRAVDYLIKMGHDVNIQDDSGKTPLHYAAKANCFGPVVSLLENGANPLVKDQYGKTPRDLVLSNKEIAYFLEKKSRMPASQI